MRQPLRGMGQDTAHWIMRYVLGRPGSYIRQLQYSSTALLLFCPFVYLLYDLRSHRSEALTLGGVIAFLLYCGVVWVTDRLYERLRAAYGEPEPGVM